MDIKKYELTGEEIFKIVREAAPTDYCQLSLDTGELVAKEAVEKYQRVQSEERAEQTPETIREEVAFNLWLMSAPDTELTRKGWREILNKVYWLEQADKILSLFPLEQARKQGREDVMEWIEAHGESTCMDCTCAYNFNMYQWVEKLKEWE